MPGDVPERGAVADDERAARDRLEPGLVVVDRDRVGLLDAGEQVAPARRDEQPAAVGRVDVEPRAVGPGEARRSRGAGRSRRSRWCRRWRRRPSARRPLAARVGERGRAAPRGPSGARRRSARGRRRRRRGRASGPTSAPRSGRRRWRRSAAGPGAAATCWPRASSSACRLDWVPPLVKTPSACVVVADPRGRPVDEVALDEGARRRSGRRCRGWS